MSFESSFFIAWQEAEKRVSASESNLFAKVLAAEASRLPTRVEVEHVRSLRLDASALMKQMLDEMRERAVGLKFSRSRPREPGYVDGFRNSSFAPGADR